MISMIFLTLGAAIGWWLRGTKAGTWLSRAFRSDPTSGLD